MLPINRRLQRTYGTIQTGPPRNPPPHPDYEDLEPFSRIGNMSPKKDEIKIYTSQDENYTIEPTFIVIDLPEDKGFLILKESER